MRATVSTSRDTRFIAAWQYEPEPPTKEAHVARQTVLVSDKSGERIPDGQHVRIRVDHPGDGRRGAYEADLTEAEATEIIQYSRKVQRGGRRPSADPT
jgi:hypothetical protein